MRWMQGFSNTEGKSDIAEFVRTHPDASEKRQCSDGVIALLGR